MVYKTIFVNKMNIKWYLALFSVDEAGRLCRLNCVYRIKIAQ